MLSGLHVGAAVASYSLSALILTLLGAYAVALLAIRTLSTRMISRSAIVAADLLDARAAVPLTDMGNYLGYARLGGLHGLNPYTHVIRQEMLIDLPTSRRGTTCSPYGELLPRSAIRWRSAADPGRLLDRQGRHGPAALT